MLVLKEFKYNAPQTGQSQASNFFVQFLGALQEQPNPD
jgi:hypothetical protein